MVNDDDDEDTSTPDQEAQLISKARARYITFFRQSEEDGAIVQERPISSRR